MTEGCDLNKQNILDKVSCKSPARHVQYYVYNSMRVYISSSRVLFVW